MLGRGVWVTVPVVDGQVHVPARHGAQRAPAAVCGEGPLVNGRVVDKSQEFLRDPKGVGLGQEGG